MGKHLEDTTVPISVGVAAAAAVSAERFEVLGLAGEGAMGRILKAIDRKSGELAAMKLLAEVSQDGQERFEREARLLAELEHPAIVRYVHHGFTDDGQRYLAMEWLEGRTLADRLAAGPLSLADTLTLARRTAEGLEAAHAAGIVHRDIKPSNLFLVDDDPAKVRIIDFGVAFLARFRSTATRTGVVVGTPGYMSPEQARGQRDIDARADLFSLGCVLYECVRGQGPFLGEHLVAVLAKILFEPAPTLEPGPGVPVALARLCERLLAKQPGDRPSSAAWVAAALEEIARAEAAGSAAPAGGAAPAQKPARVLTHGELRVVSLVLAAPPGAARRERVLATAPAKQQSAQAQRVARLLRAVDPQIAVEMLADGGLCATLTGAGSAVDRAVAGARAARAVHAALPDWHVTLATGRAQLGASLPLGEVIDRAAALLGLARERAPARVTPVVVDEVTRSLIGGAFAVVERGGLSELGEEQEAGGVRALLGRRTPMVGRERELRLIEAVLDECAEESTAHAVLVTGPAGIGKSRLRHELCDRVARGGRGALVAVARGEPWRASSPLALCAELARSLCELGGDEPSAARRARLDQRLQPVVEEAARPRLVAFLAELLGLPLPGDELEAVRAARQDPLLMHDHMLEAWRRLLEASALDGPLLLVIEDLHWADGASLEFLDAALRLSAPMLVLATARPELGKQLPELWAERAVTHVRLGELSRRAGERLVREVLGERADDALVARLVDRAAGNAFCLEELIRASAEGREGSLPDSAIAMVQVRLEALPAEPRRLLRAAAIFGQVAPRAGVAALVGAGVDELAEPLRRLESEELLTRRSAVRRAGGPDEELCFRHALVREASYAMLTEEDQAVGHAAAASWLVAHGGADPSVLAEHFARGRQPGRAGAWYARAAEQALAAHQFTAVIDHAEAAARSGAGGDSLGQVRLLQAEACRWRGDHPRACAYAAEAASLLDAGTRGWFRAMAELCSACGRLGQFELVVAQASALVDAPPEEEARDAKVVALCGAGRQLFQAGEYARAEAFLVEIERLVGDASGLPPLVAAQVFGLRAARARHVGDLVGDRKGYAAVLAAFERAGDVRGAANARVSLGFAELELGRHAEAEVALRQALAEAERLGLSTVATRARQNLGLLLSASGATPEAVTLLNMVIQESREQGNARFEGWTHVYLSAALLRLGDAAGAARAATRAIELFAGTAPARAGAQAALARALIALGRGAEALLHARAARAGLVELGGIEEFEALVRLAAAEAAIAAGGKDEARALVAEARARLRERAAAIDEVAWRESFVRGVPENAMTAALP